MKTDKIIVILMAVLVVLFSLILCTQIIKRSDDTIKKGTETTTVTESVTTDDGLHWESNSITTAIEQDFIEYINTEEIKFIVSTSANSVDIVMKNDNLFDFFGFNKDEILAIEKTEKSLIGRIFYSAGSFLCSQYDVYVEAGYNRDTIKNLTEHYQIEYSVLHKNKSDSLSRFNRFLMELLYADNDYHKIRGSFFSNEQIKNMVYKFKYEVPKSGTIQVCANYKFGHFATGNIEDVILYEANPSIIYIYNIPYTIEIKD